MEETSMKINDIKNQIVCGIYKIDFPNGKSYIGQSVNIYKRIQEHNQKHRQLVDKAIDKYGKIKDFVLLEMCQPEELDIREKYWIKYYQTNNKEKGYNLTQGGDCSNQRGIKNSNSKFSKKDLEDIYQLLIYHPQISCIDIAKKYNVNQNVISNINTGKRYANIDYTYPLRSNKKIFATRENIYKDFQNNELNNLIIDLKNNKQTIEGLSIKYKISIQMVREINQGRLFFQENQIYPIREKNQFDRKNLDIIKILDELKNTKKSMTVIGQENGIGRALVAKINKGQKYHISDYNYPARKTN